MTNINLNFNLNTTVNFNFNGVQGTGFKPRETTGVINLKKSEMRHTSRSPETAAQMSKDLFSDKFNIEKLMHEQFVK